MSVFQDILGVLSPVYSLITGKGPAGAVVEPVLNAVAPGVGTAASGLLAPKPTTTAPVATAPVKSPSIFPTPKTDAQSRSVTGSGSGSFLTWIENNVTTVVVSAVGLVLILVLIFKK